MIKRHLMVVSLTAAATFAGLGLSAFATDDPKAVAALIANNEVHDTALVEKVETLLRAVSLVTIGSTPSSFSFNHSTRQATSARKGVTGMGGVLAFSAWAIILKKSR